jgi:hypothetical protein
LLVRINLCVKQEALLTSQEGLITLNESLEDVA